MSDKCDICGKVPYCTVSSYQDGPFVDGRTYNIVCFTCSSVIKKWEYDKGLGTIITYNHASPFYLCTVEDMMTEGWSQQEAEHAIKAVKKKLESLLVVKPVGGKHILECIILSETVRLDNASDAVSIVLL